MNWVTEEKAKAAGKKSKKAAIACSHKHWQQMATATLKEWKEFPAKHLGFGGFCSFCARYTTLSCRRCPIRHCTDFNEPYNNACCALDCKAVGNKEPLDIIRAAKHKPKWLKDFQAKALLVAEQIKGFM